MSERGADYYREAKRTEHSREELKKQVERLREDADLTPEEMAAILDEDGGDGEDGS